MQCSAHKRSSPDVQCRNWAIRGMPTCRKHGSSGVRNAKLGLIRYLAWIIIGAPPDIPAVYAKFASMSAALEQLFNNGKGTPEQRLRAALWLSEIDDLEPVQGRPPIQRLIVDSVDESVDNPV